MIRSAEDKSLSLLKARPNIERAIFTPPLPGGISFERRKDYGRDSNRGASADHESRDEGG